MEQAEAKVRECGGGEVRTRADFRPLGIKNKLKSNALDQLGHATGNSIESVVPLYMQGLELCNSLSDFTNVVFFSLVFLGCH